MKYNTRDFGEIELKDSEVIEFVQPLFGFEKYRRYALLHDDEVGESLAWLQCLEDPGVCFILLDPSGLSYCPAITADVRKLLGEGEYECWVVVVVAEDFHNSTVNLKSPVFINWKRGCAAQVVLEEDFPVRFPFMKEEV